MLSITNASERRRLIALGDVRGVKRSFGIDAPDAILLSSSAADRHHDAAIAGGLVLAWGRVQFARRQTQRGKQQATTRTGGVGLPGRRGPDDSSVGPLFVVPTRPEGLQKVMLSA